MALTTTATFPPALRASLATRMLAMQVPGMIFSMPAVKERLPKHGGTTIRFIRSNKLNPALVPLGNGGLTPPSSNLTKVHIDADMAFYGGWIELNEQVELQSQDRPLNQAVRTLGIQLRETEDTLTRNMLAASAALVNCVGGVNGRIFA